MEEEVVAKLAATLAAGMLANPNFKVMNGIPEDLLRDAVRGARYLENVTENIKHFGGTEV